jgi:hypothetical protein
MILRKRLRLLRRSRKTVRTERFTAGFSLGFASPARMAAEKFGKGQERRTSGAKAVITASIYGTAKAVPFVECRLSKPFEALERVIPPNHAAAR